MTYLILERNPMTKNNEWEKRFDMQFLGWELPKENLKNPEEVKSFIKTQIIEKLIADIPDDSGNWDDLNTMTSNSYLKKSLEDKYLS